jgi:hypothetical protein
VENFNARVHNPLQYGLHGASPEGSIAIADEMASRAMASVLPQ